MGSQSDFWILTKQDQRLLWMGLAHNRSSLEQEILRATSCPQARPFSVKSSKGVLFLTQGKAEAGRKAVCHPGKGFYVVLFCDELLR